jgi:hypothetical protein
MIQSFWIPASWVKQKETKRLYKETLKVHLPLDENDTHITQESFSILMTYIIKISTLCGSFKHIPTTKAAVKTLGKRKNNTREEG